MASNKNAEQKFRNTDKAFIAGVPVESFAELLTATIEKFYPELQEDFASYGVTSIKGANIEEQIMAFYGDLAQCLSPLAENQPQL